MFEGEGFWDYDDDYQDDIIFPDEGEDFCADLLDGYADDDDDHCYAIQELNSPNESGEYLLSEDLLDGHAADDDEQCYAAQDLNNPNESDEYLLCGDLLEGYADHDAVADLDNPYEGDEHLLCDDLLEGCADYDDNSYAAQDLDDPNESYEYLSCGDLLEGLPDCDEHYYEVQDLDNPYDSDEHLLCVDFEGFADNDEYPDPVPNEGEEILCQWLMERLNVTVRYAPPMHATAKPTAPRKPTVRNNPPITERLSTIRDDEASSSQTEAGLPSLNAEEAESASGEINGNVAENPAVSNGDASDGETLILLPD